MGGYYKITSNSNKYEELGEIQSNEWIHGILKVAEVITLFNLIKNITENTRIINDGSITIFCNNIKVINAINNRFNKVSDRAQGRVAAIGDIIEEINKIKIAIYIEY